MTPDPPPARLTALQAVQGFLDSLEAEDQAERAWVERQLLVLATDPAAFDPNLTYAARPLIHWLAHQGHTDGMGLALSMGLKAVTRAFDQSTALHAAAEKGRVACLALLLDAGADPNALDRDQRTPLHRAAGNNHGPAVSLLLARGAQRDALDSEQSPPLFSALFGHTDSLAALLAAGADPNSRGNQDSAVAFAVQTHSLPCLELLWEAGADLNCPSDYGWTPLHHAINRGFAEGVRWLLAHGADPLVLDTNADTLLHTVADHGKLELVPDLLRAGVDPGAVDRQQRTAQQRLVASSYADQEPLFRRLLMEHALPQSKDPGIRERF